MKFLRETNPKGLRILPAELSLAGFPQNEKAEVHVMDDTIIVLKRKMTAMELIHAARQLHELATDLYIELAKACGFCEDCENACTFDEDFFEDEIVLPDYLREEAGIPEDANLCAVVDEENGTVTIMQSEHKNDLRDLPPGLLDLFADMGLCLGRLEELLVTGGVAYEG